jgi:hypothetical protein
MAVGTADGPVEIHPLDRHAQPVRLVLPGPCRQLCYDGQGNLVVAATRPACLLQFTGEGRPLWRTSAPANCEFRLGTPPRVVGASPRAGLTIVAVLPTTGTSRSVTARFALRGIEGPDTGQFRLVAYSASGKPAWQSTLSGRSPHLRTMEGSGDTVIAYERADRRGPLLRYRRVLACFDRFGTQQWEQGGMVYNPLLIGVSPDGSAVLSLCAGNRFVLLSGRGQNMWSYRSRGPVRMVRASHDGTAAVVATTDGQLCLLKISAPAGVKRLDSEVARQPRDDSR